MKIYKHMGHINKYRNIWKYIETYNIREKNNKQQENIENDPNVSILLFPQTSVDLRVLAALVEDQICNTGPTSVRGNWPLWSPVVSRGIPWSPVVSRGLPCYSVINTCFNTKNSRVQIGPRQRPIFEVWILLAIDNCQCLHLIIFLSPFYIYTLFRRVEK